MVLKACAQGTTFDPGSKMSYLQRWTIITNFFNSQLSLSMSYLHGKQSPQHRYKHEIEGSIGKHFYGYMHSRVDDLGRVPVEPEDNAVII